MEKPTKSASQEFWVFLSNIRFLGKLIGLDLMDENYRINFLTALVFCVLCTYPIAMVSTILHEFEKNWMIVLESICFAIAVFQGAVKFSAAILRQKTIYTLAYRLVHIYEDYEARSGNYAEMLMASNIRMRKVMKIMLVTCFVPCIGILVTPFIMLLIDRNNRFPMIPLLIPFVDLNTTSGYYTSLGVQGTLMLIGSIGLYISDLIVLVFFMQSYIFADILRLKIKEFNLTSLDKTKVRSLELLKGLFDIVEWQQEYSSFIDTCNHCYYWILVACVASSGFGIVLTLFMIVASDWPGAYPYLILGFHTLYVYCFLGTKIEICNDRFIDEIYEINWYNLNAMQQKIVLFVLMRAQNPKNIELAGIVPLSVATGLRITKTIYSMFMMMINFLVE